MRGLFCSTTAKTNEEYRKVIKRNMKILLLIGIMGLAALIVSLFAKYRWEVVISERMLGFYTGAGSGIIAGAVILWIRNRLLLNNEEKLKESRLMNSDERIKEINHKAFRVAAYVLIFSMYAVALIGGLFYPILVTTVIYLIFFFLLVYAVAYRIFSSRM